MLLDSLANTPDKVYRNIVSANPTKGLFDDLAGDDVDAVMTAINSTINIKGDVSPNIIDKGFAYSQAIAYPFEPVNWAQSRFSDGSFPCLYTSDSIKTTIHETCYHFLNELNALGECDQVITRQRAVYLIGAEGLLVDISGKTDEAPELLGNDYSYCQMIGKRVHQSSLPGIKAKSARLDSGLNYVFLKSELLSNPKLFKYLTYRANKEAGVVTVEGLDEVMELDLSNFQD